MDVCPWKRRRQDPVKTREWFQKAADAGDADAMYYLGVIYQYGTGVGRDYDKDRVILAFGTSKKLQQETE